MFERDVIGLAWLCNYTNIKPYQRLNVMSMIGSRRKTEIETDTGYRIEYYQERNRPEDTPVAHLNFHLRNEIPHLECLKRIFDVLGGDFIQEWVYREPSGQYARRSAFLYEWLTGKILDVPENLSGNYIDVFDENKIVTASAFSIEKNSRWRVNNNIAGTADFCPIIIKTDGLKSVLALDIACKLNDLNQEMSEDLLLRSASWFTFGESRASFKIEGEEKQVDKIQRFTDVMARYTGKLNLPYDWASLQQEILGKTILNHFGLRQSPVFVGQVSNFQELVHYIAPHHDTLSAKLNGLMTFYAKTQGQSAILRSAVMAFAFVYIHPLADGNGRIHRFLLNDILRRDGITQEPMILPISVVITKNAQHKIQYHQILNHFSQDIMHCLHGLYSFDKQSIKYTDGILSNFKFNDYEQAEPIWRYPNLTQHVIYIADLLEKTIQEMREEALYLQRYDRAVSALKEIIDMPDHYAERIIRSIRENHGKLSNKLAKEYEFLQQDDLWQDMVDVVKSIFEHDTKNDK